jgi:hypothetical protein
LPSPLWGTSGSICVPTWTIREFESANQIMPAIAAGQPWGILHREKDARCVGVLCVVFFSRFGVGAGEVCAADKPDPELVKLCSIEQRESNGSQHWR